MFFKLLSMSSFSCVLYDSCSFKSFTCRFRSNVAIFSFMSCPPLVASLTLFESIVRYAWPKVAFFLDRELCNLEFGWSSPASILSGAASSFVCRAISFDLSRYVLMLAASVVFSTSSMSLSFAFSCSNYIAFLVFSLVKSLCNAFSSLLRRRTCS